MNSEVSHFLSIFDIVIAHRAKSIVMKTKTNWKKLLFLIGMIAMIAGVLDPLEGSMAIGAGIVLVTVMAFLMKDVFRKQLLICGILILAGIAAMFYISSLGGLGENALPWKWGLLILPYPIGWVWARVVFLIRSIRIAKENKKIS